MPASGPSGSGSIPIRSASASISSSAKPWLFGGTTRTSRSRYRPLNGGTTSARCAARSSRVMGAPDSPQARRVSLADRTAVQGERSSAREFPERRAERRLPEQGAARERGAVVEEHVRHAGVGGQERAAFRQRARERPGDGDASVRERDRRSERLGPRKRRALRVQGRPSADRSRNGDRVRPLLGHRDAVSAPAALRRRRRPAPARSR